MDLAFGRERGFHPSLGWGLPPYNGDHGRVKVVVAGAGTGGLTAALSLHAAAFNEAYRSTTLPDVASLNSRPSLTP
jgi:hypothetical protein